MIAALISQSNTYQKSSLFLCVAKLINTRTSLTNRVKKETINSRTQDTQPNYTLVKNSQSWLNNIMAIRTFCNTAVSLYSITQRAYLNKRSFSAVVINIPI